MELGSKFLLYCLNKISNDPSLLLQVDKLRVAFAHQRIEALKDKNDGKLPLQTCLPDQKDNEDMIENTFKHNSQSVAPEIAYMRPLGLLGPLLGTDKVLNCMPNLKVLIIGPRTEYELLWYVSRGFKLENITALDLFTYSPYIQIGDMHAMAFADQTFDIVVFSWVLGYSKNQKKAVEEAVRVLKPNGFIGIGEQWDPTPVEQTATMMEKTKGYRLEGTVTNSVSDLLGLFEGHNYKIVFQTEPMHEDKIRVGLISLIVTLPA